MSLDPTLFDLLATLSLLFFSLCFMTAVFCCRMHLRNSESFLKDQAELKLLRGLQEQGRSHDREDLKKRIDQAYSRARLEALEAPDSQYYAVLRSQFDKHLHLNPEKSGEHPASWLPRSGA